MSDFRTLDRTAASQYGLLTRKQLLAMGWSARAIDHKLQRGHLVRKHRGVYAVPGVPSSWEQDLCAAALATAPFGAASLRAAARLWGFRTVDSDIEVSILYPRHLTLDGVVVHRSRDLDPNEVTWINGIAVTTPERTICDLGLIFPEKEVRRILFQAVANGIVEDVDLWAIRRLHGKQGRNGVGVLSRILEGLPQGAAHTESGVEITFLALCRDFGLSTPASQFPVVIGGQRYRLDFAYPAAMVCIEIEGFAFHGTAEQLAQDSARQNALTNAGWTVLRFGAAQLTSTPARCAQTVRRSLKICDV